MLCQEALRLPQVNLFIADDVGLGNAIEAGLIARELLLRKKVQDIVVACPPSTLPRWKDDAGNRAVVAEELEAARERREVLKAQIHRLQNRLKASQDWLALREEHFRSALSCALG